MELFFEVQRLNTHIMADTRENATVAEIKNIISGIVDVPSSDITLKRATNETRTNWETLESDKTLSELGFTPKNAKPDEPAVLGFTLPGDKEVQLTALSDPPPLPDQMQQADQTAPYNNDA